MLRILCCLCLGLSISLNVCAYTTPEAFMQLYFEFGGNSEPDYPRGQLTIPQVLIQSQQLNPVDEEDGPLILLLNSSLYIYDKNRKLLYSSLLRTNRSTGFFELTAVSHIGPAMSYLARIKENGDPRWRISMQRLLKNIKAVRTANKSGAWLKGVNSPAFKPYQSQIQAMVDYALSMSGNYIVGVLQGEDFNLAAVQNNFLHGNEQYPISYNAVMVATFMLTMLESMTTVHDEIKDIPIDWPHAMVIVRIVAGTNVTSGLTKGSNWMVPFLVALSNYSLPENRILIAPYAEVKKDAGSKTLSEDSYNYYKNRVWVSITNRAKIASSVFTDLETIYLPGRPLLPGDYAYSKAGDIEDFMVRLKFSFQDPTQMLSNSVGFWMADELAHKKWDVNLVRIPGLTDGLPKGITKYPTDNPEIGEA